MCGLPLPFTTLVPYSQRAAAYGEEALEVATTLKLGRTLWLIPAIVLFTLWESASESAETPANRDKKSFRLPLPSFILPFLAAAAASTLWVLPPVVGELAGHLSKALLVVALFFVGTDLTRDTIKRMRGRVLWLAIVLWSLVVPGTLILVVLLV